MTGTTQPLDEVQLLRQENAVLRAQIAWFQQRFFGGGKGEKLAPAQLRLKLANVEEAQAAVAEHTQKISYERPANKYQRPRKTDPLTLV